MATSDQPYSVGSHITFVTASGTEQSGTIVSRALQVVLDGSQTAYTVELDTDAAGGTTLVGITHTDVMGVAADEQPTQETTGEPETTPDIASGSNLVTLTSPTEPVTETEETTSDANTAPDTADSN
jgi:hypothetical protein